MKTFIKKTALFSTALFIFLEAVSAIILYSDLFLYKYPGKEVYAAIEKSKKKHNSKILILGDSVGRQLFDVYKNHDSINSLACNQSISVAGHYFLLNNYLQAGNRIEKLFFIYNPLSFKNNLDQVYTYHYFIKPFNNSEYQSLFTPTVEEQIEKVPYSGFAQLPHIKITSWAPEFNVPDSTNYNLFSPVSLQYLSKIKTLAIQHNFEFVVLSPPVNIKVKNDIEKSTCNLDDMSDLQIELEDYLAGITYLDSLEFMDRLHLLHPERYQKSQLTNRKRHRMQVQLEP